MKTENFTSYHKVYRQHHKVRLKLWILIVILLLVVPLFLPWTQNIRATGTVTALRQEDRPQQVNALINGRIEKWFISEGEYVKKGDTLVQLSEISPEYLDPDLLKRTAEQISAKNLSVESNRNKVVATNDQAIAMSAALSNKIEAYRNKLMQAELALVSDSVAALAADNDWNIARLQFVRQKALHDSGLISLTQFEARNQALQAALAKKTGARNRYMASRQELTIIRNNIDVLYQEYRENLAKVKGERFSAESYMASGQGEVAKLRNQLASLAIRNRMYFILAPQDGQVVQAANSGIGEVIKEGEVLVHIVPDQVDHAVEMYVRPVDLPLVSTGQVVRFLFDGFPAIVFSGWPRASYGTYQGVVTAIENNLSPNGKYKILVKEDRNYRKWPAELRMGNGAKAIALLKDVPLWYELWRNINSFPPDYYKHEKANQ